ncbi:ABC transporter permease [Sphaerochaeta sp. PS]|uniref:ABC transporter permease n=1 Tax=Sphaerochaeta sp. PS TaxID=3076336 RepID=UPI0028A31968|nr:ABC transporter permease [Sphaerochaeta sp. PS]MDT4761130.1 ABC transporter permease [Sphaerochaeta sp. PS]
MTTKKQMKSGNRVKNLFFRRFENGTVLLIFLGFIALIIVLQLILFGIGKFPTFISPVNIMNILQQVSVPGIIAVGMTLIMISGGIDLSVGMLASLVSIITALGISKWNLGVPMAILLGIMSAVVLETIMGFIISRTKAEPFIITLGGMITFQGIALLLSHSREVVMQGELNFLTRNLIEGTKDPVTGLDLRLPPYVLIFFVIALIGGLMLSYTKYGRRIYSIGTNPYAAYLAGINVKNMRLSVYMIQGLLTGIGAVLLLARINTGIITLGENLEIDTIAMVVIGGTALSGGKGNIVGTLIGIFFLGSIGNAMNLLRLPSEVQFLAKGLVIIISVSAGDISLKITEFRKKRRELQQMASKT